MDNIIRGTLAWNLIKEKEAELEAKGKIETAENALRKGLSVGLIAELTGLFVSKIETIKKNWAYKLLLQCKNEKKS